MPTIVPVSYTARFGGLPGTVVYITRYGDGWQAQDIETGHYVCKSHGNYYSWGHIFAAKFHHPQDAADAAEKAVRW